MNHIKIIILSLNECKAIQLFPNDLIALIHFHLEITTSDFRYISYSMYLIVREMHRVVNSRKLYVHCIGHSLGGQSCGLSGKLLIQEGGDKFKYDRISGMDPAGPLFCEDVPYPFNYKFIDPRARLGPNDAHFVDVIHTDGGARYLQFIPQVISKTI